MTNLAWLHIYALWWHEIKTLFCFELILKIPGNSMNIPEYSRYYSEMICYSGKVDIINSSPGT